MMNYHQRPIMTPVGSRKRKEPEPFFAPKPAGLYMAKPPSKASEPIPSNRLLAGYMAYEFLTKGSLMGQEFDPGRAESKVNKPAESQPKERQTYYAGLASILKTSEAHVPGVVNPSQLARWIKM